MAALGGIVAADEDELPSPELRTLEADDDGLKSSNH